jgi:proline dehydrogenase
MFGTHNWTSSEFILEEIVKKGLGTIERAGGDEVPGLEEVVRIPLEVGERVTFSQLYGVLSFSARCGVRLTDLGMSDALTNHLVWRMRSEAPCVLKYVPYGALVEVSLFI